MADGNFVPKSELIAQIRLIVTGRETGYLTILTDTRRSVLLRFSSGKLTHSLCRTKDVGDAIQVLNECNLVRFTYAAGAVEDRPELMPADSFLQLLDPGGASAPAAPMTAPRAAPAPAATSATGQLRMALIEVAIEYVGPVAEMIVDEALENTGSVSEAVDYIADMIPDSGPANAFRDAARSRIPFV